MAPPWSIAMLLIVYLSYRCDRTQTLRDGRPLNVDIGRVHLKSSSNVDSTLMAWMGMVLATKYFSPMHCVWLVFVATIASAMIAGMAF